MELTRDRALALLKDYNREPFHLQHAYTVEAVMRDFAREQGYGDEADFWGIVGLLHDVDYERYPGEHCVKAREILAEQGAGERLIHAVVSHGYGIVSDVAPEHELEKILFAVDELTGLIGAVAIMRPSKSMMDLEVKSVKKKFKTPSFAAGCSREVITKGVEMMGATLEDVIQKTILALRQLEQEKGIV